MAKENRRFSHQTSVLPVNHSGVHTVQICGLSHLGMVTVYIRLPNGDCLTDTTLAHKGIVKVSDLLVNGNVISDGLIATKFSLNGNELFKIWGIKKCILAHKEFFNGTALHEPIIPLKGSTSKRIGTVLRRRYCERPSSSEQFFTGMFGVDEEVWEKIYAIVAAGGYI